MEKFHPLYETCHNGFRKHTVSTSLTLSVPFHPDPTLTVENVVGVMEKVAVERRKKVWSGWDILPGPQLEEIYQKYSTEGQRIHACADFYVNCRPHSSWTHLHLGLYGWNEMTAVRKAKTFIPQTGKQ